MGVLMHEKRRFLPSSSIVVDTQVAQHINIVHTTTTIEAVPYRLMICVHTSLNTHAAAQGLIHHGGVMAGAHLGPQARMPFVLTT
jgi:hypothetical protein